MTILHIVDILNAKGNGVAVAMSNYTKYESKECNVAIYCLNDIVKSNNVESYSGGAYKCISDLPEPFNKPDIVVFNEVYKPKYIKLYKECISKNIKYVIIPHGCLVRESQKKRKIKKFIGNTLLFNKFIYNANAIQFLNESEKNNSNFKYKKAIIAGNGVEPPSYKNSNDGNNKNIVFIGRYNIRIKGLDLICNLCEKNKKWFMENNVKIILYGRDTLNNLVELKQIVKTKELNEIIIVNDAVYGKEKEQVLKDAYAFIQCSRHEGQPMGILEALSVGLPCIVTYGTSLGEFINENKCGIVCNFDSNEVFSAICSIIEDDKKRKVFSKNSFISTNKYFCWENVIKETLNEYKKILKGE